MSTTITKRNISTKYFGNIFDLAKVDRNIYIQIYVYVPKSLRGDNASTVIFKIEKTAMDGDSGADKIKFNDGEYIDSKLTLWIKNITAAYPTTKCLGCYMFELERDLSKNKILDMNLDVVPGFRLSWKYIKQLD